MKNLLLFAFTLVSFNMFSQQITEFHYDNAGNDTQEFIEVYIPSNLNSGDYTITLYNGSNNNTYGSVSQLGSAVSCDNMGCYYVINYASNGLQNGDPDGIALCGPNGFVQFLSYEGTFTASGGCADGTTSTSVGISEGSSTPIDNSLALENGSWTSGPATPGAGGLVLPMNLINFSSHQDENQNILYWTVASEKNNDYFEIFKSTNGKDFDAIGQVSGSGNSATKREYKYIDRQPSMENYYRLKQVDYDGTSTLSKVIAVIKNLKDEITILTTKVNTTLTLLNSTNNNLNYAVSNVEGKTMITGKLNVNSNDIDCSTLSTGIYVISVQLKNQVFSEKFIKI